MENWGACRPHNASAFSGLEEELSRSCDPGTLYRCTRCRLGFRFPRPDSDWLEKLYASINVDRWQDERQSKSHAWQVAKKLIEVRGKVAGNRILDVGAFTGGFLCSLPGWVDRFALEPSAQARNVLASRGITVVGDVLSKPHNENAEVFDVVCMFDVFEHLPDPLEGLKSLLAYAKPGGTLFISTGNMDHWSFRLLKGGHWYLDPVQHISFGSQAFFQATAPKLGCKMIECRQISHQSGTHWMRLADDCIDLYFGLRMRSSSISKACLRALQFFHPYSQLKHKSFVPYTHHSFDHLFVALQKN